MKLFLVGGFLGSGKTTAIVRAAKWLIDHHKRVGVITNDQGIRQVDTLFIRSQGITSEEVAGGCFCCNFEDLDARIASLKLEVNPEIIFAESVGSCTDLAATVINPLLKFNPVQFDIVLSVFADVRLLIIFLQKNKDIFYDNVNYIYEKQFAEADIIVINKIDLLSEVQLTEAKKMIEAEFKNKFIIYQNSLEEDSVKEWLSVCDGFQNALPRPSLDVDYNIYGAGEAELAWLDEEIHITTGDQSAFAAGYELMKNIHQKIINSNHSIGHLKFLMQNGRENYKISFNSIPSEQVVNTKFAEAADASMLINARVQISPDLLEEIVAGAIMEVEGALKCSIIKKSISAFRPGFPRPTHRISAGQV